MLLAVFDIGGTNIKYGVGDSEGYLVVEKVTPTKAAEGGTKLVEKIKRLTRELQKEWPIRGVAISTAGSIDSTVGKVIYATETIPGYSGMNVKQILETELQLPVELENDVHCGALGELSIDVSSDAHTLLFLTIGTGIGGSLAIEGQIHKGATHLAGAIGHMNLYPNGRVCSCGQKGCFEQYASASRLEQQIREVNPQQQLPAFMEKVTHGDNASVILFHKWLNDLALGLQSLIYIWNPDSVIIGGGISAQGKWLEQEIEKAVFKNLLDPFKEKLTIRLAKNGNRSNLLGAIKNYKLQQVRRDVK
ncbi:ROK family protein [Planococcus donghaensis MPA1U2]|uniref:ROK family protein n=1 Tax=Planococcus donghaensis MPA1U2 TaxID=933115 RepID=E7RCR1_9BACL|nr:ROK family protein [Planococcus donghaensis]EGA91426.1 ROK family protein [Planococcus donghaensis MPA1U2]